MGLRVTIRVARTADEGSTFVEYALVIAFIVLASLAALHMIGVDINLDVSQMTSVFR